MLATKGTKDEAALLQVSQDIGAILVRGIRTAVRRAYLFQPSGCHHARYCCEPILRSRLCVPLRSGFVRHGILPPSMAVATTHAPDCGCGTVEDTP
jgi:hypothetical protein